MRRRRPSEERPAYTEGDKAFADWLMEHGSEDEIAAYVEAEAAKERLTWDDDDERRRRGAPLESPLEVQRIVTHEARRYLSNGMY